MSAVQPNPAATKRISIACVILKIIKEKEAVDGTPDLSEKDKVLYSNEIKLLCDAGFLREIPVTEGGLPYRITWKGLSFLDTFELFNQAPSDPIAWYIAQLVMFSFH